MRIVFSSLASADIRNIGSFIARDNPVRARSFSIELREKARQIADLPEGFPLVPRYEDEGIRRRSWKGYGILYSVAPDRVVIHRIIGPGQDQDRALRLS